VANVVEFSKVTKSFGLAPAVDDVSFEVADGETLSLLGPSGCGKTTTLRLIAGFETPNAGSVRIAGEDMADSRPYQRNIGLLFQHYALFPHMTVGENVAYGLRHRGFVKADIPNRVGEMLKLVKLSGFADRKPAQLSGGQQQRVALARALATRPKVVLLDEPLSALDAKLREELRTELKEILGSVGSTTIVVTHDQEEAMSLGDRIIVMNQGRIAQLGSPEDIYSRPTTKFVAEFMGRSNWFSGRILSGSAAGPLNFETESGLRVCAPTPRDLREGQFELCIRPERIDLLAVGEAPDPRARTVLPATIVDMTLLGPARQFVVQLGTGEKMTVVQSNRFTVDLRKGSSVNASFLSEDIILIPAGVV
jgi:ABC-type Fe3+/spermidine/putrescine transport system ATPase subunit